MGVGVPVGTGAEVGVGAGVGPTGRLVGVGLGVPGRVGLGVGVGVGVGFGAGDVGAVVRTQRRAAASHRTRPDGHRDPVFRTTSPFRGVSRAASTPTVVLDADTDCRAVRDTSGDARVNADVVTRTGEAFAESSRTAAFAADDCFAFRTTTRAGLRSRATARPPVIPSTTRSVVVRVPSAVAAQTDPVLREMRVKVALLTRYRAAAAGIENTFPARAAELSSDTRSVVMPTSDVTSWTESKDGARTGQATRETVSEPMVFTATVTAATEPPSDVGRTDRFVTPSTVSEVAVLPANRTMPRTGAGDAAGQVTSRTTTVPRVTALQFTIGLLSFVAVTSAMVPENQVGPA